MTSRQDHDPDAPAPGVPADAQADAFEVIGRDSLTPQRVGELSDADVARAEQMAARQGFDADACRRLPGRLLP